MPLIAKSTTTLLTDAALEARRKIVESAFTVFDWHESGKFGWIECPGIAEHTTESSSKDCCVTIVGDKTGLRCFHHSCTDLVATKSEELQAAFAGLGDLRPLSPEEQHQLEQHRQAEHAVREREQALHDAASTLLPKILSTYRVDLGEFSMTSPTPVSPFPAEHYTQWLQLWNDDDVLWLGEPTDSASDNDDERRREDMKKHFRTVSDWKVAGTLTAPFPFTSPYTFKPGSYHRGKASIIRTRYLVIESDDLAEQDMLAVIRWVAQFTTLRAVLHTGNKSLHAWFDLPLASDGSVDRRWLNEMRIIAPALKLDEKMFSISQPCRVPGFLRDGQAWQRLLWINPDPKIVTPSRLPSSLLRPNTIATATATVTTNMVTAATNTMPPALAPSRRLDEFALGDDNGGCLLGRRFLNRGSDWLFVGQTGVGKTCAELQSSAQWALGRPFLGIEPSGPLKTLIIQSENDDGDIAHYRDNVFKFLGLSDTERKVVCDAVRIITDSSISGEAFVRAFDAVLAGMTDWKPDILMIDPLFAYLGDDVNSSKATATFIRNGLKPIIGRHRVGLMMQHHTNKPVLASNTRKLRGNEMAYSYSGHNDLANAFRAVSVLLSAEEERHFVLHIGKRGSAAGLVDAMGNPTNSVTVKWAEPTQGIGFEVVKTMAVPKSKPTEADLLAICPWATHVPAERLELDATKKLGFPRSEYRVMLAALMAEGKIHRWEIQRKGCRAAIGLSRSPQPSDEHQA